MKKMCKIENVFFFQIVPFPPTFTNAMVQMRKTDIDEHTANVSTKSC